jgi:hypothetical protein
MPEKPTLVDDWRGGWEEHRRLKFTRGLNATPAQRLARLEEMIRFAHRAGALPKKAPAP